MDLLRNYILFTLLLSLTLFAFPTCAETEHCYLVMAGDGSTSMTVQFQTTSNVESTVQYGKIRPEGDAAYESTAKGSSKQIPGIEDGRHIHAVELSGLTPGTMYYFKTASGKTGQFRTLPNDGSTIRAAFGGDMSESDREAEMLKIAAKESPDVAVLGGDIAYVESDTRQIGMWDVWLERWEHLMVRPDGGMIPIVMAIGNHEVHGRFSDSQEKKAPAYFGFFAQGGKTSFTRDLGPYARVIALDTGHITGHGKQRPFLREALKGAAGKPFVFATYHVPLFPSHRPFSGTESAQGREYWQPLFDEFDLTIGFEHHDHTFKRTKPIRGEHVDPEGTTYLGDGCFGQTPRDIPDPGAWYLEKSAGKANVWIVDITREQVHCRALGDDGGLLDELTLGPRVLAGAR